MFYRKFELNLVIKKVRIVDRKIFCYAYEKVIGIVFLRKKLMELVTKLFWLSYESFEVVK